MRRKWFKNSKLSRWRTPVIWQPKGDQLWSLLRFFRRFWRLAGPRSLWKGRRWRPEPRPWWSWIKTQRWCGLDLWGMGRIGLAVMVLGSCIASGVVYGPRVWRLARSQPYFAVREIVIRGIERVKPSELLTLSGIEQGQSIWRISPELVSRRLETNPWIRRSAIRRRLPRTVVVEVTEWEPQAIVVLSSFYYVDWEGNLFARVGAADDCDLPFITGLPGEAKASRSGFAGSALHGALDLLKAVKQAALSLEVSELNIDQRGNIRVFFSRPAIVAEFGWGGWTTKVSYLKRVLARWRDEQERLARISLAYTGQAVVRLRGGGG